MILRVGISFDPSIAHSPVEVNQRVKDDHPAIPAPTAKG
jgi:hypothetical protein